MDRVVRAGVTVFPFETDFYAGNIRAAILRRGRVLASVDVDVDPDIAKLTRDEYASMVSDIARSTLALYRLGAVTLPAATDAAGMRSDLVTLDLVRSNFDAFERAVARIADQPIRTLRSTAIPTDIMRTRRVDDRAIATALRSGASRVATKAEARAAPRLVGALGGRWVPTISEIRREERLDIYENRALLGFIRWLERTLAGLSRRLAAERTDIHPATAAVWLDRLRRWRARLSLLSRRDLFASLIPVPSLHATNVFRLHPDYASAFSAMSRMKAGLGTGAAVAPAVPIDRTHALYESWCYLNLLHAAAEAFPACRPAVAALLKGCTAPNKLGAVLARGEAARFELVEGLTMTYQRRFSTEPSCDGSRTLVVEAIPDVTLARCDASGRSVGIVVMDPKYRTGKSLTDGIRDMHVYRDAIVSDGDGRLVVGAVILAPRPGNVPVIGDDLPTEFPAAVIARPGHDPQVFRRLLGAAVKALS